MSVWIYSWYQSIWTITVYRHQSVCCLCSVGGLRLSKLSAACSKAVGNNCHIILNHVYTWCTCMYRRAWASYMYVASLVCSIHVICNKAVSEGCKFFLGTCPQITYSRHATRSGIAGILSKDWGHWSKCVQILATPTNEMERSKFKSLRRTCSELLVS